MTRDESPTLTPPIAVPSAPPSHSAETWWHCLPADEAIARLGSDARGLSDAEAAQRLAHSGYNEIEPSQQTATIQLLLSQFSNILILILLAATAVSAYLGHEVEAVVIAVIVLFAVLLGFVQEFRAERAMDALRKMAAPTATVIRGGQSREVAARSLVPGDIVQLQTGNRIPADLRLIEAVNLRTDEAALTGESTPIDKDSSAAVPGAVAIGERCTMAYAGTVVTYGRGSGVVVATGMDTEFGRIVRLLRRATPRRTPLQQNLDKAGRSLAIAALIIVAVIVAQGVLRGESFIQMLVFGIALAVAVVPEALPAVVTISLALGAHRMIRRNALIRRLPAVETLGCTSVICSDKTGTLTKDEMTVRKIWTTDRLATLSGTGYEPFGWLLSSGERVARSSTEERLLRAATLASDARLARGAGDRWQMKGDPTEGALVVAATKLGLDRSELDTRYPRIDEIPFTSESKRMTTLHRTEDGGTLACSKGAVEVILEACGTVLGETGVRELDEDQRIGILEQAHELAAQALRVLAVAERRDAQLSETDHDLVFLGLVGMIDPPRPESRAAVERCEAAGIRVIMITGDHPSTAQAVASELGILRRGRIITGPEIDEMSTQDFARQVGDFDVYARVSPEHKLRVVDALQRQGHIVAMTGDGVNDAPALKQADIGIAMGIAGTDVSREAAAMTLIDDNFASIVAAVEEGRGIFNNIKKYLMYLLAANIGEIGLIGTAAALGLPMPLSAVQILYVNLATDGLPALALAMDPNDAALMRQKPRDPRTGIFNRAVVALMLAGGLWSMAVNLALFQWAVTRPEHGVDRAMTIVFAALVLTEFFKAYSYRSYDRPISRQPFGNRWLNLAIVWELGLLVSLLYVPPLQRLFGTVPLDLNDWAVLAASAFSIVPLLELVKWTLRRAAARRAEHG
ncbi:MAG: cation-translocating P-type ATPase [Methylotetracoccus sp.]